MSTVTERAARYAQDVPIWTHLFLMPINVYVMPVRRRTTPPIDNAGVMIGFIGSLSPWTAAEVVLLPVDVGAGRCELVPVTSVLLGATPECRLVLDTAAVLLLPLSDVAIDAVALASVDAATSVLAKVLLGDVLGDSAAPVKEDSDGKSLFCLGRSAVASTRHEQIRSHAQGHLPRNRIVKVRAGHTPTDYGMSIPVQLVLDCATDLRWIECRRDSFTSSEAEECTLSLQAGRTLRQGRLDGHGESQEDASNDGRS